MITKKCWELCKRLGWPVAKKSPFDKYADEIAKRGFGPLPAWHNSELHHLDPSDEWCRRRAKALCNDDTLAVDHDAEVEHCDGGAWVQAWVFVPRVVIN